FLKVSAGAAGASVLAACTGNGTSPSSAKAHVIVVGGGWGGATAARYLRQFDPDIQVTMIDPNANHVTCPASNWVIGGFRTMDDITHSFDNLQDKHGVNVVKDYVSGIDPDKRTVSLKSGGTMSYDRLILSPGIDFAWESIE